MSTRQLLRPRQIWTILGISKVKYWADVKEGRLPKPQPVTPGSRAVGTPVELIEALIAKQQGKAA